MDWLQQLGPEPRAFLSLAFALLASAVALAATHALFRLRERRAGLSRSLARQVAMLVVTVVVVVAVILALPVSETLRGQLIGLIGVALTGVVAFASTTFVANAMAGLMLRAVGNFRIGDWLRVGDQFGRVTERGLFHTEIQTEDRDLATLPNLFLVTNAVKVVRESGTFVSADVSLGYDVPRAKIERLLLAGARSSGLEDPFVHLLELGDFSVHYRVAGFLAEVRQLLSARSRLHAGVLDSLHAAGIEIVSPNFMNQRVLAEGARFVPPVAARPAPEAPIPEERIFDKADERASLDELRGQLEALTAEVAELERQAGAAGDDEQARLEGALEEKRQQRDALAARLATEDAGDAPAGEG